MNARKDITSGKWRIGRAGGTIVVDAPPDLEHHSCLEYYGGVLIAESVNSWDVPIIAAAPDMREALRRAERKLSAYIGVCAGDKELTDAVLPMVRAALANADGAA